MIHRAKVLHANTGCVLWQAGVSWVEEANSRPRAQPGSAGLPGGEEVTTMESPATEFPNMVDDAPCDP